MAYLMHIGFDNSSRLARRIYYFKYKGIKFKLIQNERKWCDVLLTVTDDPKTGIIKEKAFESAAEFLTALSWENNSLVKFRHIGGPGRVSGFTLRKASCSMYNFPEVPFVGSTVGYGLKTLPKIETDEQRIALALFREAKSSNNIYLSFLFYWQVMEVGNNDAIGWLNKAHKEKRNKIYVDDAQLKYLDLGGKSLGNYFYDDRRNAIAHINKRKPNKAVLKLDTLEEITKAHVSARVISEFAALFIKDKLNLTKRLNLVRTREDGGFPVWVDDEYLRQHGGSLAYSERPFFPKGVYKKYHHLWKLR